MRGFRAWPWSIVAAVAMVGCTSTDRGDPAAPAPADSVAARVGTTSGPSRERLVEAQDFYLRLAVTPGWTGPRETFQLFEDGSFLFRQDDRIRTGMVAPKAFVEIRAGVDAFANMSEVTRACPRVMDADIVAVEVRAGERTESYRHNGCLKRGLGCASMLFEYLVASRSGVDWKAPFRRPPPGICDPDAPKPVFPGDRGRPTFLEK